MTSVVKTAKKYEDKPLISAFVNKFEVFLKANNMPNISGLENLGDVQDYEYVSDIYDQCNDYMYMYIDTELNDNKTQRDIIKEFGFKKLIDIMCSYKGDEICELELFDINDNDIMHSWVNMILSHVANLA
jgi:hypothetical protein